MKRAVLALLAAAMLAAVPLMGAADDTFAIRGATVNPVSGPKIENATLLVVNGTIAEIGNAKLAVPKGTRIIDGKGLHVYPGIIDSSTQVGMSEISSVRETSDVAELGDFKPQLRAAVAINPSSEHIPVIRANGTTTALAVPGGGLIAGQASMMHLDGWTWEDMTVRRDAAMVLNFPTLSASGDRPFADSKRNYDQQIRTLSQYMESARRYQKAKAAPGPDFKIDLALEAMLPVLDGKMPLLVGAERERAVRDAIAWADREKLKIVLFNVRRPGKAMADIKSRDIPVILGPTQELPLEEDDPYDEAFTVPLEFHKAGVKFAFGTFGNQFARNLPYQAATAVAFGLPYEEALKAITINPAEIFGISATTGSVEKGKWADLILTDGDPLEVKTQVKRMFIKGKEVDLDSRHTRLYKKYMARP